ncbi:MAG: HlyD family efflux transporter periplasmic adaptor subunit [[Clostridium] scindens]
MARDELTNIQVYRKKWNINIGIIIFGVIFIYLVVTVLMYLTNKHVSAYEVREGSILKDTAYTGLIIRDETVVNAEADGYVNTLRRKAARWAPRPESIRCLTRSWNLRMLLPNPRN